MERLRSWWQYIRNHWIVAVIIALVIAAMVLIFIESLINGTGFNGYNKITVAHTISGTNAGTVIRTEEYQPGRTLWDWMQLLFIPVVLAVAGFWFNHNERRAVELRADNERKAAAIRADNERKAAEFRAEAEREIEQQRAETEREIATDNQREATLQAYIDKMSELLLDKGHPLRESAPEDEVRKIARVRTLTVLPRLDKWRKRSVLQFLYESGLIEKDKHLIDLGGADLSEADLIAANLRGADLSRAGLREAILGGANLREAKLSGAYLDGAILRFANLDGADLRGANLRGADLRDADLRDADLGGADLRDADLGGAKVALEQLDKAISLKGATMPDGKIHP